MTDNRNGYGVLFYENSTNIKYRGNLIDNKPHGNGILFYNNEKNTIQYEGHFEDGKYENYGTAYYEDNTISFRGHFKEGKWSAGYGELYAENNFPIYKGNFDSDGDYDGHGVLFYECSRKIHYIGNFKACMFHGKGKLLSMSSNVVYEGDFQNDEMKGVGKCYRCNGCLCYEGEMEGNLFNGRGKEFYSDGKTIRYDGCFKDGKYHGHGKLFDENHTVQYEGLFVNGENAKKSIESFGLKINKYECLREAQEKIQTTSNLSKENVNSICETIFEHKEKIEEYDYIRMMDFLKSIY